LSRISKTPTIPGGIILESIYLKTLVEVARTGSFSRAAETLCVTQSAVSRRIKFLEEHFATELLDRSGAHLSATPPGNLVLEKAKKILELEQDLLADVGLMCSKEGLSFASTPTFGIVHLPHILREFMLMSTDAEDLKFIFDLPGDIVKGLQKGLYDMAVIEHCQCFDLSEFDTISLPSDEMIFAGAPSLGLHPPFVAIEELFRQTLFGRHEGCCSRTLLENNLKKIGHQVESFQRLVVYDDLHIIVQALLEGGGIAFISNDIVKSYVERGLLVQYRVDGFTHQRSRTFAFSPQIHCDQVKKQFMESLFGHFQLPSQFREGKSSEPMSCSA